LDLLILYFSLAIGISFLCSILESVLLSVNMSYVSVLEKERPKVGRLLKQHKININTSIASILILNTVAHTLGAAAVGAQAESIFGSAAMFYISIVLTFAILFLSEIIPKAIGALYWKELSVVSAYTIQFFIWITYPIIMMTLFVTNRISKGKDSINSLTKAELLESALMIRGYTLVKSGDALKVIPISETKQTNVEVQVGTWPDFITDKDTVITQVMPLKYSSSLKIKNELQSLVGKHGNILANARTNTVVITDTSSNIKGLATIISQLDRPLPASMQVKAFVVNYGDAAKIAKILNDLSKEEKDARYPEFQELGFSDKPLEIFGEIDAFAEEETNSIVVASAPVNFPALERLIEKLDVFPPQAMIEVVIMDVTLDDDLTMGVEYASADNPTLTTEGIKSGSDNENIFHSLLGLSTQASTSGFTYRILNDSETTNLLGFILKTQENSKVLSTPRILASNSSVLSVVVSVFLNRLPRKGISPKSGILFSMTLSLSRIKPPRTTVCPSGTITTASATRLLIILASNIVCALKSFNSA